MLQDWRQGGGGTVTRQVAGSSLPDPSPFAKPGVLPPMGGPGPGELLSLALGLSVATEQDSR